jgi:hypothetical protein
MIAELLVSGAALYAAVGLLFGLLFVTRLAARLDEGAASGTWGFKLAILPGAAALWPWLLILLVRGPRDQGQETAHDRAVRRTP